MKALTRTNLTILILLSALLMSCGSRKVEAESTTDQSSRIDTSTNVDKPFALCSQGYNEAGTIRVNVGALVTGNSQVNPQVDPNYAHIKISNVPTSFSSSGQYFSIWRWYSEMSGSEYIDSSPISFKLVKVQTNEDLTGYMTSLAWSSISSIASTLGAATPNDFFQKVRIFAYINDPGLKYDALTISLHEASTGKSQDRIDVLIPAFYADPRDYQETHSATLQSLHPFASVNYFNWSPYRFTTEAEELCNPLTQY